MASHKACESIQTLDPRSHPRKSTIQTVTHSGKWNKMSSTDVSGSNRSNSWEADYHSKPQSWAKSTLPEKGTSSGWCDHSAACKGPPKVRTGDIQDEIRTWTQKTGNKGMFSVAGT